MAKLSAGILVFKHKPELQVLLVHPGGPFFSRKDEGAWTIPKGEPEEGEELIFTAAREFEEELGFKPEGSLHPLGETRQKGGKVVHCWALEGNLPNNFVLKSSRFDREWPPRSGRQQSFPEIDRAEFFDLESAAAKINEAQQIFLLRLAQHLGE